MSDKTSSWSERVKSLTIYASWIAGFAVWVWVWAWAKNSLIQDGIEKGVRNPIFETIWPAILGFFAAAAVIWAVQVIVDEISRHRSRK